MPSAWRGSHSTLSEGLGAHLRQVPPLNAFVASCSSIGLSRLARLSEELKVRDRDVTEGD